MTHHGSTMGPPLALFAVMAGVSVVLHGCTYSASGNCMMAIKAKWIAESQEDCSVTILMCAADISPDNMVPPCLESDLFMSASSTCKCLPRLIDLLQSLDQCCDETADENVTKSECHAATNDGQELANKFKQFCGSATAATP